MLKEINHWSSTGKLLWQQKNLPNLLHLTGEAYLLGAVFNTASVPIPANYYFGLDNRTAINIGDTLSSVAGEPNINGYARQAVASTTGFTVSLVSGNYQATTTSVITFTATGGNWAAVQNLFLATTLNNSGYLISSVAFSSRTVTSGQSLTLTFFLGLQN